jgi:ABC-2 type transport system ATP-binding protein
MAKLVVATENLTKRYGTKRHGGPTALKDLNLEIEEGAIYGFIGPNGAGKTTTLKILATLLLPTEGTAKICDVDLREGPSKIRSLIGYMPDFFGVYDDMKVWEYMDFFGAAFRIDKLKRTSVIDDLLGLVDLTDKKDAYVESLSRGMKQRLCLARALIHDPKLLILDEPASGLDPRARVEMRELLKELKNMGKTIIVSSHILPELSELCTHIGIIEKGELLVSGSVDEIVKAVATRRLLRIRVMNPDAFELEAEAFSDVGGVIGFDSLGNGSYSVEIAGGDEAAYAFLSRLIEGDIKVVSFYDEPTDLEEIFFKVTKGAVQ